MVASQHLSNKLFGLQKAKTSSALLDVKWLANNSFSVKLPDDWWEEAKPKAPDLPLPPPKATDEFGDAKAAMALLNEMLVIHPDLYIECAMNGKSAKLVRQVTVMEELG